MPGMRAAIKYAYSSTRVKAMESKLVKTETLNRMLAAKEPESIAAMLLQTSYKSDLEKYGGGKSMNTLIDFALSNNLGRETSKLISIAPKDQKGILTALAGEWDVNNIKLLIETASTGKSYDDISRYIIETAYTGPAVIKEALGTKSTEGAIERLMRQTPYSQELKRALEAYRKSKNPMDANAALEHAYYMQLGSVIGKVRKIDNEAAALIQLRIDMRNLMSALAAKRQGAAFSDISSLILPGGNLSTHKLEKLFKDAKSVENLAGGVKMFDLKGAVAEYDASKAKPLLLFEIAMLNQVFTKALRIVRHSVLSFRVLLAFLYLKEIEVFTLRVLIKGKSYGLSDRDIMGMISWLK